jgi:hypothetical protein
VPDKLVAGLFSSSGAALDACNRLHTEGFPTRSLARRILKEIGPLPPTVEAELEALSLDPMVWGDVRQTFAHYIRDGETAVLVRTADSGEVEAATDILSLYGPLVIETFAFDEPTDHRGTP